jgi:hypothetical protein
MKRFFRLKLILTLAALVMMAAAVAIPLSGTLSHSHAASAAQDAAQSTSGKVAVSKIISPQAAAATRAYWTPARMQSARSADELLAHAKFTQPPAQRGPSGVGTPAIPTRQYATKIPHSSYSTFPYSTVGKVFFTDPQTGTNFVCSGAAVNSTNLSVVDTAGHCVVNGGSGNDWYTNWTFCPQYFKGSSPYGCWVARQLWSITSWVNSGSFEDDFGDAVVSSNTYGNIVNVVGGTGWAYGQSTSKSFTSFGYPAASPFNGNLMYKCGSTKPSTVAGYDDGTVIAIACNMTGGSSGGPWLTSFKGAFGYVNGHNDFKYTNDPNHMYSPYYDSDWYIVFNAAQTS